MAEKRSILYRDCISLRWNPLIEAHFSKAGSRRQDWTDLEMESAFWARVYRTNIFPSLGLSNTRHH